MHLWGLWGAAHRRVHRQAAVYGACKCWQEGQGQAQVSVVWPYRSPAAGELQIALLQRSSYLFQKLCPGGDISSCVPNVSSLNDIHERSCDASSRVNSALPGFFVSKFATSGLEHSLLHQRWCNLVATTSVEGESLTVPQGWPLPASTEVWVVPTSSGAAPMTVAERSVPYQRLAARLKLVPLRSTHQLPACATTSRNIQ